MNRCRPARSSGTEVLRELLGQTGAAGADERSDLTESEAILLALAQAVEQRDKQTAGHCERLALISVAIGIAMRLPRPDLLSLYRGGYLHDIGKVGMPDSILLKSSALNADEWVAMRSHPLRGEEICRPLKSLEPVLPVIRSHHERWDGSGYPDGLRGRRIPLLARVLQTADIYDALSNPRPYKPALTANEALAVMSRETDRGWRDPETMALFVKLHAAVIVPLAACDPVERSLRKMRGSMRSLQRFLAREEHPSPSTACRSESTLGVVT